MSQEFELQIEGITAKDDHEHSLIKTAIDNLSEVLKSKGGRVNLYATRTSGVICLYTSCNTDGVELIFRRPELLQIKLSGNGSLLISHKENTYTFSSP